MKRTFVYATALMIAVAGLLAVARGLLSPTEHEMGQVRRGEAIETVYATGTIEARLRRTLKAHRLGVVGKVYVKEGDEVRAGDPLLRMRDTALAARKRSIKAELARVTEKLSDQSAFRKGYEARLTQARETASELRATQGRLKRQLGTGGISRDDYESAATRALVAAEALARLEEDLRRELADLAAALEKAQAAQEAVFATELDDLLTAPIDGIVLSLPLKEGEFAAAGQILAKVGDIREMIIEAEVNEDDIAAVEVGKPVHIRLAGAGTRMLKGRIYEMLPDAIRATKGYTVRARFDKAEFIAAEGAATTGLAGHTQVDGRVRLFSGMTVELGIVTAIVSDTLIFPRAALTSRNTVFVFNRDAGKVKETKVDLGLVNFQNCEARNGLQEGQRVILTGVNKMSDGDRVKERQ